MTGPQTTEATMANKKAKKLEHSPRYTAVLEKVDVNTYYSVDDAIAMVKSTATAKFPETVDLAVKLGVDAKKSDQNVRGITNLPNGTGKVPKVWVLAKGEAAAEAEKAGADRVGDEDLIKAIQEGEKDFDIMIASGDMAPQIGKIGRFLGAKTPNKRNNTVTDKVGEAVKDLKAATRVEYRIEKAGIVHLPIGKVTLDDKQLKQNFVAAIDALVKAKPSTSKGVYIQSVTLSSTMGPGVKVDPQLAQKAHLD